MPPAMTISPSTSISGGDGDIPALSPVIDGIGQKECERHRYANYNHTALVPGWRVDRPVPGQCIKFQNHPESKETIGDKTEIVQADPSSFLSHKVSLCRDAAWV